MHIYKYAILGRWVTTVVQTKYGESPRRGAHQLKQQGSTTLYGSWLFLARSVAGGAQVEYNGQNPEIPFINLSVRDEFQDLELWPYSEGEQAPALR